MKKIIVPGLVAGLVLVILLVVGLYITNLIFPGISLQYFDSAFDTQPGRYALHYLHPFVVSLAMSWFWSRFKGMLTGSFITRGIEFGLIYILVAIFPMMWLAYSAMNVSLVLIATWFVFAMVQAVITGLVFEKMNP